MEEIVEEWELTQCEPRNLRMQGPAVIRRIEIVSPALDRMILRMAFDRETIDAMGEDGPFQVDAPLRVCDSWPPLGTKTSNRNIR